MNIGAVIRDTRKSKGITQKELALKSGVSQAYLSQIENSDQTSPTIEILYKISESLGVPYPVLQFLTLEHNQISKSKLDIYKKYEKTIKAVIAETFFAENDSDVKTSGK